MLHPLKCNPCVGALLQTLTLPLSLVLSIGKIELVEDFGRKDESWTRSSTICTWESESFN